MINYAKIENGIVTNVIICNDSQISTQDGYHVKVTSETNQAEIGHEYDATKNKFKSPQPFESWTLNADTLLWEAPVAKPEGAISWDEANQSWFIRE
jgi:hypothetical protein